MKAHSLRLGEGFKNPLGFHSAMPTFSWKLPVETKRQTAYQIQVNFDDDHWDSSWVESEQSVLVPWEGKPFRSRQRAEWQVRFRDENGTCSDWSETAHFEIGLLQHKDWSAQWIRPTEDIDLKTEPVSWLRRHFSLTEEIVRARLYVTARGIFEIKINGRRVGRDYFANGFTAYDKRIDTLTCDTTSLLQAGQNTIEAMLGTGWYAGRFPFDADTRGVYGKNPELLLQLEVFRTDGSCETISSDDRWQSCSTGPILSSSMYDGEVYDARIRCEKWSTVHVSSGLGSQRLTPKPFAPIREICTLATQTLTEPQPGRFVFDLGQNIVGWPRIRTSLKKNQTLTLRYAEILNQDGTLYTENYRSAKSIDYFTAAKDGPAEWEPCFTFHGFRYVELSVSPAEATFDKSAVSGVVLASDLPKIGHFESSHAKLNQLQNNIGWGWRGNSLDIPTDCPQRDERLGWTGDAQVFGATAMFNTDSHAFWKSWLTSLRDGQKAAGHIPDVIPSMGIPWERPSPGWLDAATFLPWQLYVRTGDHGVLEENFSMMEKLLAWYRSHADNGVITKWESAFGDWLQPCAERLEGDTAFEFLASAYYARSAQIVARTATALEKQSLAETFNREAKAAQKAFSDYFFNSDGRLQNAPETQTSFILAIAFDLLPRETENLAASHLERLIQKAGGHLRTGFLGTPLLTWALDKTGRHELAFELLFRETWPSWFYPINQGATTMWERWNSYSHEDGFGDAVMNSFNHYAYGAVGQWMYERLAGLAPDSENPGYKHFFVRPLPCARLSHAKAELETPYGKAMSGWKRKNNTVEIFLTVPPNTTATVEFPDARTPKTVGPGQYQF
ncbi:MAG: family 78 glycoside hydrolase catalytic domain [Chthoniobacterales bacterium]